MRVVGKQPRVQFGKAAAAARACPFGGEHLRGVRLPGAQNMYAVFAQLQCQGEAVSQPLRISRFDQDSIDRHLNCMFLVAVEPGPVVRRQQLSVYPQLGVALTRRPGSQVGIVALAGQHEGGRNLDSLAAVVPQYGLYDLIHRLRLNRHTAIRAVLHAQPQKQEPDKMVQLGYGGHRALPAAPAGSLLNCDGRRNPGHAVHLGTGGRLNELTGIRVQRFQIAPLTFVKKYIKGDSTLAAAADPGYDGEGVQRYGQVDILEIVLPGSAEADEFLGCRSACFGGHCSGCSCSGESFGNVALQRFAGVTVLGCRYLIGASGGDELSAGLPALRAEVDNPVAGPQYIEVVLDHHQRVPGLNKLAKSPQQSCNIVKMQPGGRFVEEEQNPLPLFTAVRVCPRQMSGQLQALRLTPAEGRQGLPQPQITQPHIPQGFQFVQHPFFRTEKLAGLLYRHFEHVGNRLCRKLPLPPLFSCLFRQEFHLQDLRTVAGTVTIRTADIHIAEKLHFDVLEAATAAGRAAALGRVKAESAGAIAPLFCQGLFCKLRPDRIEGAYITDRIRPGGFTYRTLIDQHDVIDKLVSTNGRVRAGLFYGALLEFADCHVEHILNKGRLAGSAHAADADELIQRNVYIDVPEVVFRSPDYRQHLAGRFPLSGGQRFFGSDRLLPAHIIGGKGSARLDQLLRATDKPHLSAGFTGGRTQIYDDIGGHNYFRIVFNYQQGISRIPQPGQNTD